MATREEETASKPAVRFSSQDEEIEPAVSLDAVESLTSTSNRPDQLTSEAQEELKNLSISMQKSRLQSKRLENFSFEPVSLPPSRAPSPASSSRTASLIAHHSPSSSPLASPHVQVMHSPPLTPAGTASRDEKAKQTEAKPKDSSDPALMTPQVSPPHEPPPTSIDDASNIDRKPPSPGPSSSNARSPLPSPQPKPVSDMPGVVQPHPKHAPTFSIGPTGDSVPASREVSPAGTPGTSTPVYSRPFTPQGERDDPYARSKRAPQSRGLEGLEARFIFSKDRRGQHYSPNASSENLPRSKGEGRPSEEKRASGLFSAGKKSEKGESGSEKSHREELGGKHHGSMSELKRFFKLGGHKHGKDKESKRGHSPAPSIKSARSGTRTPPTGTGSVSVPFADDHGLSSKYGKFGKVLGSGAGGSVRLMKRSSDGVTFAVKQFRAKHSYETEREYSKKVTAEFCIGSTLHHGNVIETMDLVHEKGNWYVVMEYAPYDLFAIVMTGKMSREEITCATLQILSGVTYLHSMGLAHRDLKLDNVVVNEHGIMKIIDFGSAAVFRYPFENDIVLASGIVGSDPYLAPEVYDLAKYDPQPTDIWSLAIMFCCMTLRRFPWKAPRLSDNSYKLFVSAPSETPRSTLGGLENPSKSAASLPEAAADAERRREHAYPQSEPASRAPSGVTESPSNNGNGQHRHHHHHHQRSKEEPSGSGTSGGNRTPASTSVSTSGPPQQQVIKGPWRLLRLLPRESRHIIGRMLEVDPKKRATMDEILADRWVSTSQVCRQEEGGRIIRAEGHTHTLEPGASQEAAPPSNKK